MNSEIRTGGVRLPFFVLAVGLWCTAASAQPVARPPLAAPESAGSVPVEGTAATADVPVNPSLAQLLRVVLIEAVPETLTDDRHWDRDTERFDGFRVEGLKIIPRKKRVEHGFWQRYTASLLHPDETLQLVIQPLAETIDGRAAFDVTVMLKARIDADFAQWAYGVKGINGSVVSDATVHTRVRLVVAPQVKLDWDRLVPDVGLDVLVSEIDMRLRELHVHRIGIIDGWLARQIGDGSRNAVQALLQRQSKQIAKKLQSRLNTLHVAED